MMMDCWVYKDYVKKNVFFLLFYVFFFGYALLLRVSLMKNIDCCIWYRNIYYLNLNGTNT